MKQDKIGFFSGGGVQHFLNYKTTETFGVNASPVPSPAQQAATRECQHPQQPRPQADEPFEPHGMN